MFLNHQSFCWSGTVAIDLKSGLYCSFEFIRSRYKVLKPDEFVFISDTCYFFSQFSRVRLEYAESFSEEKPEEEFYAFTLNLTITTHAFSQIVKQL